MDNKIDVKKIQFALPLQGWKRPPGRPCVTWLKIVQNELKSHDLTLTEALDVAQNHSLWKLLATFSATHSSSAVLQ